MNDPTVPGRLLLIAPPNSYRTAAYIEAAKRRRIPIEIASEGEHSLIAEIASGLHIQFDDVPASLEKILKSHEQHHFSGVVATDDFTVEMAAKIAQQLQLPHNPPQSARIARRKDLARQILKQHDLPVPQFKKISLIQPLIEQIIDFPLPAVIKPLGMSASRGVIRVNDRDSFLQACEILQRILRHEHDEELRHTALLEQYIDGAEVAVEGLLHHGCLIPLAIFDKPEPLTGPYFEESYYVTPSRLPQSMQTHILKRVQQACSAYGLVTGPVHAELRLFDDEAWILELAARTIGGECARLLEYGTGHSLEELVISYATATPLDIKPMEHSVGVLMIPTPKPGILRRVEGVLAAQNTPLIQEVIISVREGHELNCLPDAASYLGFIFARGENPAVVEQALRQAHAQLKVVVDPLWKITGSTR
ncbi:MAG: ATP-grasp domain-containing protein [Gammaproteobacteria bacterium]|nr:ATP-grasp domain-containing protein [Gammaproteobacteria bacterium]MDH5800765.1 ATP-grasp domain-containing protein [Gammaproteobacteria bacterium]